MNFCLANIFPWDVYSKKIKRKCEIVHYQCSVHLAEKLQNTQHSLSRPTADLRMRNNLQNFVYYA